MARYRNKITGDIITAHLFDGDVEALKRAMPLFRTECYRNVICEVGSIPRYVLYSNTSLKGLIDIYRTVHKVDFESDFEPYEEPTISNAMQAVKWLEEGKAIYRTGDQSHKFNLCKNGTIIDFENAVQPIKLHALFMHTWELYEKPKYKEVDYNTAILAFANDDSAVRCLYTSKGEEKEYILWGINSSAGVLLAPLKGGYDIEVKLEEAKEIKWRLYE